MLSEIQLATVGVLVGAGAIVLALAGVAYGLGRRISAVEAAVSDGLSDVAETAEANTDELRNVTDSLAKIELYVHEASHRGNVQSDGGVSADLDFQGESRESGAGTDVGRRVDDGRLEIGLDSRRYVTEVVVRPTDDGALLPAIDSLQHRLEREIEAAIEDRQQLTVDVQSEPERITIIVPRTDEATLEELVELLLELLPQWLDRGAEGDEAEPVDVDGNDVE